MKIKELTITEIKDKLEAEKITEEILLQLENDSRQGVKKLAARYRRLARKKRERIKHWEKLNLIQHKLAKAGYHYIAGIDEAGRGPLAGPVVAAAVILNPEQLIMGLDDSKKLSPEKRESLFSEIKKKAVATGIGIIDNQIIDEVNILQATFLAMKKAIADLGLDPDILLIDGNMSIPNMEVKQQTVIDGDARVNAIAAASILAKVTRDRIIDDYDQQYPHYGFIRNKGYGTREHIQALQAYGPSSIHRFSFSIVKECSGTEKTNERQAEK